jgi:hypothetical protein
MDDQLTFRIPRALARALARKAKERSVPRGQLVREALTAYLATRPAATPAAATIWERIRHYAGSLELDQAAIETDEIARRTRDHNWRETPAGEAPHRLALQGWEAAIQPGVDILDRDTLFDVMDGR